MLVSKILILPRDAKKNVGKKKVYIWGHPNSDRSNA